jgi:hypothetical protein
LLRFESPGAQGVDDENEGFEMSATTYNGNVSLEWDDSVVLVFSFTHNGTKQFAGFGHQVISLQSTTGTQTQVSAILQNIQQTAVQFAVDPATWVETVKTGARGNSNPITIVYDDSTSQPYTTQTAQPFQLQILYSIAG